MSSESDSIMGSDGGRDFACLWLTQLDQESPSAGLYPPVSPPTRLPRADGMRTGSFVKFPVTWFVSTNTT